MSGSRDELTDLPGVDAKTAEVLRAAGFRSVDDLRATDEAALVGIEGVGPRLVAAIAAGVEGTDADGGGVEEAAGRSVGAPASGLPVPLAELVAETPNALVLSERARTDHGCAALLDHQTTTEDGLVLVSFVEPAEDRLEAVASLPGSDRGLTLLRMGGQTASAVSDTTTVSSPLGEATVTTIHDETDLFRLGVHLSRALDEAAGKPALCLHSLSALVELVDVRRVTRFLRVLCRRIRAVDGRAHYHLDPRGVDDRTFDAVRPLFDVILRFQGGEWTIEGALQSTTYEVVLAVDTDEALARRQAETVAALPASADSVHATILHDLASTPTEGSIERVAAVRRATEVLEAAGVEVTLLESSGDPVSAILGLADDLDADLICVGDRKRTPSDPAPVDTVAQDVFEGSERPVLLCSASDP